jgi:amino acid transporter
VWAFAGWEILSSLSAEYRDPARDIRRATFLALGVVTVLYLGIAFATVLGLSLLVYEFIKVTVALPVSDEAEEAGVMGEEAEAPPEAR